MELIQHKTTQVGRVRLHYAEAPGKGPTLVLLHGITDSHVSYLPMMPQLAQGWRVVAPDLRGHGLSDHVPGAYPAGMLTYPAGMLAYRVRDYADDVASFLHAIGGESAVLVGHSLGGLVAACTAGYLGNGLRGVFLEDPPMYKASMPAIQDTDSFHFFTKLRDILRHHAEMGASADDLVESITDMVSEERLFTRAEQLHQLDPWALDAVIEGRLFEGFNPDEVLPKILCPTHLLAGQYELGGAMDEADVQRVVSKIPKCTYTVLEGVGHDIHHEWPHEYKRELRLFLANLSHRGRGLIGLAHFPPGCPGPLARARAG